MILFILYIIINIFNFFLSIFLKFIFKSIHSTSIVLIKNKRLLFTIKDLYYKNNHIDKLRLVLNNNYFPSISINYLEYHINNLNAMKTSKINFELWSNSGDLARIYERVSNISSNFILFNLFIRVVRVYYSPDLYLDIYGFNIFKLTKGDVCIRLKIKTIKVYYLKSFVGKVHNFKVTFRPEKTIYCDAINILFNRVLLDNNFLDIMGEIYKILNSDNGDSIPNIMVKQFNMNIYLHNYIAVKLTNFVFENTILHLAKIKIKIWKKDSIWADNIKINILDKQKRPIIENIRVRLFHSTSDKLYKSLIILRKKFISITKRPIKQTYKKQEFVINNNYIHATPDETAQIIGDVDNIIIDEYIALINRFASTYKLTIVNLVIKLSYKYGEIYAENLEYKVNENYNILTIHNWKFYNKQSIFIKKHPDDNSNFCIKFNKTTTCISPYRMHVYFDFIYFKHMCSIFKTNIERLNNLFYSSYYIYNKGYVYEHFQIDSFVGVLNYKKTHKNFRALLEGNSVELLNYIDITDVNILLNEVKISYPKNWDDIIHKIAAVYKGSIYNGNFKSIITKISGEKPASLLFIKDNLKYFKRKIINSVTNK